MYRNLNTDRQIFNSLSKFEQFMSINGIYITVNLAAKFKPIWLPNFSLHGSQISAYMVAKFQPKWRPNFSLNGGRISA